MPTPTHSWPLIFVAGRYTGATDWSSSFAVKSLQTLTIKMEDYVGALVTAQVDCAAQQLMHKVIRRLFLLNIFPLMRFYLEGRVSAGFG
jgi:hypothetical protein